MVHSEHSFIPFSVPFVTGHEVERLSRVVASDHTQGDGPFTTASTEKLRAVMAASAALLTTSCSHALDMSLLLLDVGPGDEVVLPSFTFPSAGNAIAQRGATAVFVDCDDRTGNIDVAQALAASGPQTKAIIVMHYGGMPVDLEPLLAFGAATGIAIIEDAAHAIGVDTPLGRLGTLGTFGTLSFHATKNIQAGEGGALIINDDRYLMPAEVVREKGTNRSQFLRGQVDKYTWVARGSSYLPSEYNAAVLDAQLDAFATIQVLRTAVWDRYRTELAAWAEAAGVLLMDPPGGVHASHVFYLLVQSLAEQSDILDHLRARGVQATFHYQPLHSSPAGIAFGRRFGSMSGSDSFASRLVRLPLWAAMSESQVQQVIDAVMSWRPERHGG